MTIFLVRHGETEWNLAGRYQGWSDSPLTERGVAQATAIGLRLRDVPEAAAARLVTSPLGRAYRTATIISFMLGRSGPPRVDQRLREISLGSWDGVDRTQLRDMLKETSEGYHRYEWYFRSPDGESYDAFAGRIGACLDELGTQPAIVVCHGIVSRVLRGLYAGLPREAALSLPVPQDRIFRLAGDGTIEEIVA